MGQITITNRLLPAPQWGEADSCSFDIFDNVDVWKIITKHNLALINDFPSLLTADETKRADRFFRQTDRDRFIISRIALKLILAKYIGQSATSIEFGIGKNKKPYVKNQGNLNLHYNLSHSEDAILLAISNFPIGADVEHLNSSFSFKDVLDDNFGADEISYINEKDSSGRFFRIWTRKEAITKATAQGLDVDLRLIPGIDGVHLVESGIIASDDNWVISSFNFDDKYAASIAASPVIEKIVFFSLHYHKISIFA